ncbi:MULTISPECIES: ABC transporter permease [Burkholderia]|uniref:ABC transporter permease n=1 Tax=Burkholderia TaxID=32008 RepID=UPI000757D023|nr:MULTISPECIES: ABC transporter permease [Burkholderia]KVH10903.1 ABC transporter permease [Burkholderia anthina]KVH11140.1 ABC transporter permease [Burkholderia anthina]KVM82117.1 ABC transporter permease [Burkholderia anthina]KVN57606.1 ABC transporter permease [Burkholderia anthina]KVX38076.1 ABC transporter permease [Burkholderia anthina]
MSDALATRRSAAPDTRRSGGSRYPARVAAGWLGVAGLVATIVVWWAAIHVLTEPGSLGRQFAPDSAFTSLRSLCADDHLVEHALVSLRRIGVGLGAALLAGVPLGLLLGRVRWVERMLSPTFQFLRMVSPLSWMPLAVMSFGIGDRAIYFLLGFAALWPVLMSTAAGVAQIDRRWLQLGASLAATRRELLVHIVLPAIAGPLLNGIRLAIGILWIVLVPAEMLGVNAGLGYLILDTRDRLAYAELTAVIVVIGALGFTLDGIARGLTRALLASDR